MKFKIFTSVLVFFLVGILIVTSASSNIYLEVNVKTTETDQVFLQINLFQFGDSEIRNVLVKYYLRDNEDNIVSYSEQTIALDTQASIIGELHMPNNMKEGKHEAVVEVLDVETKELFGSASHTFFVNHDELKGDTNAFQDTGISLILVGISFLVFLIVLYVHNKHLKRHVKPENRIGAEDIINF